MKKLLTILIITATLVTIAQMRGTSPQKISDGVWVHSYFDQDGNRINSLIVEEDSTVTLVDIPNDRESAEDLLKWINESTGKEIGQLIVSSYNSIDSNLIDIFSPMVIHDFKSVVTLMGAGELVEDKADMSVQIGNFTIFDATPRLSMLYPGDGSVDDNLIVFNIDDKVVYLGSFIKEEALTENTEEKDKILDNINFIEKNTESCEFFIKRTGKPVGREFLSELKTKLE